MEMGWDGDSCLREWMGTGTISKLVAGIEVGMGSEFWGRSGIDINICSSAALLCPTSTCTARGDFFVLLGRSLCWQMSRPLTALFQLILHAIAGVNTQRLTTVTQRGSIKLTDHTPVSWKTSCFCSVLKLILTNEFMFSPHWLLCDCYCYVSSLTN